VVRVTSAAPRLVALVAAAAVVIFAVSQSSRGSHSTDGQGPLQVSGGGVAPYLRVTGNRLVQGSGAGQTVELRGVNRSGTEYECIAGKGIFDGPHPDQIDSRSMIDAMLSWDIDVVRVPLNEDCWLGINGPSRFTGASYREAIAAYVRRLSASHLFVILDLHWAAPGSTPAVGQIAMPDADHAPAFWRSVAFTFRRSKNVIFDLYNEPFGVSWQCWRSGCDIPATTNDPAYRAVGMQQLVDAVRSVGATQPVMLSGIGSGTDLSQWLRFEPYDPLHEVIASEHNYGGRAPCSMSCRSAVVRVSEHVPVVLGEIGETDCGDHYVDAFLPFAHRHGLGYVAWAWNSTSTGGWTCAAGPSLISSWGGDPTAYGKGVRQNFVKLGRAVPALVMSSRSLRASAG
jgi:endoglucanase